MTKRNTRGIGSNYIISKGIADRYTCDNSPVTLDSGDPGIRNIRNRILSYAPTQGKFEVSEISYGLQSDFCQTISGIIFSGFMFNGSAQVNGTTYTSDTVSYDSILIEYDINFSIQKVFYSKCATNDGKIYPITYRKTSTGEYYVLYATYKEPTTTTAGTVTRNYELYNSDGTLGDTIACKFTASTSTSVYANSIIVKYDSNGNLLWASSVAENFGGSGQGYQVYGQAIRISEDEQSIYMEFTAGFSTMTVTDCYWYLMPTIHGTSYPIHTSPGTQYYERTYIGLMLNSGDGTISDYVITRGSASTTQYRGINVSTGFNPNVRSESGYYPTAIQLYQIDSYAAYWDLISGSNTPIYSISAGTINVGFAAILDISGNLHGEKKVSSYYNTTTTTNIYSSRYGSATLPDDKFLYYFQDEYTTSWTGRNFKYIEGYYVGGGATTTTFTSGREGGNGAIGALSTILFQMKHNPSDEADPIVEWSMTYGPSPTSSQTTAEVANNGIARFVTDGNLNAYAIFLSKSNQFWNGSAYIDACPTYGKTYPTLLVNSISLENSGSCNWYKTYETTGSWVGYSILPTSDTTKIYTQVAWIGNLKLSAGNPDEVNLDNGGGYSYIRIEHDALTGEILDYHEHLYVTGSSVISAPTSNSNVLY